MKRTRRQYILWPRALAFAAAMALVVSLGAGCIFDTRSANPAESGGVQKIPLDDPLDVFTSMKTGLEGDAIANYQRALSDVVYYFSPLVDDSLDQTFVGTPDVYSNWTKDVEVSVTNLLLSEYDSLSVTFNPAVLVDENTFVRYRTTYSIRVVTRTTQEATTYKGIALIDVRREGGVWQVQAWDESEPVEPDKYRTWGYLRGLLRQRLLS